VLHLVTILSIVGLLAESHPLLGAMLIMAEALPQKPDTGNISRSIKACSEANDVTVAGLVGLPVLPLKTVVPMIQLLQVLKVASILISILVLVPPLMTTLELVRNHRSDELEYSSKEALS
jgi:hypothetical protein